MKKILSFIGLFFISILTFGVVANAEYDYISHSTETLYDAKNGLETSYTNDICQTDDGFIWLGQYVGLTKFDGINFKLSETATIDGFLTSSAYTGDTNITGAEVPLKQIMAVENGPDNSLFIGSKTEGLLIYADGSYYKVFNSMSEVINDIVCALDTVYVGTKNGLFYIKDRVITEVNETMGMNVVSIGVYDGHLYFVNNQEYIYEYSDKLTVVENSRKYKTVHVCDDGLFAGTNTGEFLIKTDDGISFSTITDNHAVTTICHSIDRVYIGTDCGLFIYENGEISEIDGVENINGITNIMVDYEGTVWITSTNGVSKIQSNLMENIFIKYQIPKVTVNANIKYKNLLYIGTEEGLYIIDEINEKVIENSLTTLLNGIRIRDLIDYEGVLYIATYDTNDFDIVTYDGEEISYILASDMVNDYDTLEYNGLGQIRCFQSYNDYLAIGTNYGITLYYKGNYKTTVKNTATDGKKNGLSARPLYVYMNETYIFSCSDGAGIEVFDYDLNYLDNVPQTDGKVVMKCAIFKTALVYGIGSDLYYCSENGTHKMHVHGSGDISGILVNTDTVAICTTSEIFYFTHDAIAINDDTDFDKIGLSDGLLSGVTGNSTSYYDDENDTYYFSCINGVYKLDYNNYSSEKIKIKIAINQLKVDGKPVYTTDVLNLDRNCSRFVIDFSILSFKDYGKFKVYYKLVDYDKEYNSFDYSDSQTIVYTNLDGGDYTFHLYCVNEDGVSSNEITFLVHKELKMNEQSWFYPLIILLIVLSTLLICYIIFYFINRSIKKRNKDLKEITNSAIEAIAHTIDAKDKYTNGHSIRVAKYSLLIAKELQFNKADMENLYYIALLHDIGKIGVPDNILNKPGKLSDEEFAIMKKHPVIGEEILKSMNKVEHLADGVLYHHERYDGKGYPNGLKGEQIPLYGRIICCADSYDAMASKRCYRSELTEDFIINEFKKCSGSQFDPLLADIVIRLIKEGKFKAE